MDFRTKIHSENRVRQEIQVSHGIRDTGTFKTIRGHREIQCLHGILENEHIRKIGRTFAVILIPMCFVTLAVPRAST